jgi:uncharacterized protein with FMN-binding domain
MARADARRHESTFRTETTTMHRAPIVLTATALGLAATLGFHPRHAASAIPTAAAPAPTASSSSTASSSAAKTVTGDAVATQYGNVQLKVTITGGKITAITPVQLPSGDPRSSEISSYAVPQLRQSALAKQSAAVDAVSGATFTSAGYKAALQSALDRAGFKTSGSAASA